MDLTCIGGSFIPTLHGLPTVSAPAGGCYSLAQPLLSPDAAHTYADECCSLALPATPVTVFLSRSCSQSQISCVQAGATAFLGMICPQTWPLHLQVGAAAWLIPGSHECWMTPAVLLGLACYHL